MNTATELHCIMASRAAEACGFSPFGNPYTLYLEYTGQNERREPTEAMKIGAAIRPSLVHLAMQRLGGSHCPSPRVLDEFPFIGAKPAGLIDSRTGLEVYNVGPRAWQEWGPTGTDLVPAHVLFHCEQDMLVFDLDAVMVGALMSGHEFRTLRVERSQPFIDRLIETERKFWERVQSRTPPEPDFRDPNTWPAIAQQYGVHVGQRVELSDECLRLAKQRRKHKQEIKNHEAAAEACKARILHAMGDAEIGRLPDTSEVRRKEIHRRGFTVKPSSYVDFRISYSEGSDNDDG